MTTIVTQSERIARLETEVAYLTAELRDTNNQCSKMLEKFDELLALKNKGMGAFWLVSMLFIPSVLAALASIFNFFKLH